LPWGITSQHESRTLNPTTSTMDEASVPATLTWRQWLFPLSSDGDTRMEYPILEGLRLSDEPSLSVTTAAMNTIHEPDRLPYCVLHFEEMATSMMELLQGLEWLEKTPIASPKRVFYQVDDLKGALRKIALQGESSVDDATDAHTVALVRIIEQGGLVIACQSQSRTGDRNVTVDRCIKDFGSGHIWIVWEDKSPSVFENFDQMIISLGKDAYSFDSEKHETLQGAKSIMGKVRPSPLT
jgi:hypothetical protein